ncbi:MAG: SdpI family protein, partial [Sphingomonadales bacterium]
MNLNKIFYGTVLSAILMGVFSLYAWFQLPEGAMVPVHWNIDGDIDGYASKTWGLFLIPLITLGLGGLLKALPYLEPRRKHLEKSPKLIGATWIGVGLVMWVVQISTVGTALGWAIDLFLLLSIAIGLMMMLIGNYAAKSQSMFLVGFRTPWTLSSETVWIKTHRLFGRLFMIGGIIMIVGPFIFPGPRAFFYLIMATVMV